MNGVACSLHAHFLALGVKGYLFEFSSGTSAFCAAEKGLMSCKTMHLRCILLRSLCNRTSLCCLSPRSSCRCSSISSLDQSKTQTSVKDDDSKFHDHSDVGGLRCERCLAISVSCPDGQLHNRRRVTPSGSVPKGKLAITPRSFFVMPPPLPVF